MLLNRQLDWRRWLLLLRGSGDNDVAMWTAGISTAAEPAQLLDN